jgi:hypothetical protein
LWENLPDFDSVSTALKGVTGAYYLYPIQVPGILEGTAIFAQAAIEEGVGLTVNMSQIAARKVAKSHASQDHWIAERSTTTKHLRDMPLPVLKKRGVISEMNGELGPRTTNNPKT